MKPALSLAQKRARVLREIRILRRQGHPLSAGRIARTKPALMTRAIQGYGGWAQAVRAAGLDYEAIRLIQSWTRDSVIAAIQKEQDRGADLHIGTMYRRWSGLMKASKRLIGSWRETLEAAGVDPTKWVRRPCRRPEDVLHEIRSLCARAAPWEVRQQRKDLVSESEHHFGSFSKALQAAGIPDRRGPRPQKWTHADILDQIRKLARRGVPLRYGALERRHIPWLTSASRRFGSLRAAVEAAGISYLGRSWRWPREQILRKLKEMSQCKASIRSRSEYQGLRTAAVRCCGSWRAALAAAGLLEDPAPWPLKQWSPGELRALLTRIRRREGRPRLTDLQDVSKPGYAQPYYSIKRRYGTWEKALAALGFVTARRLAAAARTAR